MAETKSHSTEELLAQVQVLSLEVERLRRQTSEHGKELGIRFLLDEFKELGEFWRHADSRAATLEASYRSEH